MRLTSKLCELKKGFWFKNIWKKKSQYRIAEASIPTALTQQQVKVLDPLKDEEMFRAKTPQVWIPPDDPRFMFPPRPEDDPDWKPKAVHTCDESIRLWEGLRQVQLLTNTLVKRGLPSDIKSRANELSTSEQDHLMQRVILQANLWDTTRDKLPTRKVPDDISVWHYKTEFGIPRSRNIEILLRGITQKCAQLLAIKEPETILDRHLIEDHVMSTHFMFDKAERTPIHLTSRSRYLLTSTRPLKRFADKNEVIDTSQGVIEDMYPISPLVDLKKSNIYRNEASIGYSSDYKHGYHNMLFIEYSKDWPIHVRHANAILMSYAHCLEIAKRQHVADTLITDPVCVQTVHTDGESFGFTCFQLNTLSTVPDTATMGYTTRRNMAWVDDAILLEKITPRRAMLRDTKYDKYNPDVFCTILGMFAR